MTIALIIFWVLICIIAGIAAVRHVLIVIRLISCWAESGRLIEHLRLREPDVWESLGRPRLFLTPDASSNCFKDAAVARRLSIWLYEGGPGVERADTRILVEETRLASVDSVRRTINWLLVKLIILGALALVIYLLILWL